jgi:segregation and condensation protein B
MLYRVSFADGSSDYVEGTSAADAREIAEADFGQKVKKVEVVEDDDEEEDDEDDDADDEEGDEEESDDDAEDE